MNEQTSGLSNGNTILTYYRSYYMTRSNIAALCNVPLFLEKCNQRINVNSTCACLFDILCQLNTFLHCSKRKITDLSSDAYVYVPLNASVIFIFWLVARSKSRIHGMNREILFDSVFTFAIIENSRTNWTFVASTIGGDGIGLMVLPWNMIFHLVVNQRRPI